MQSTLYKKNMLWNSRRNWIIMAVLLGVLIIAAAVIWYFMSGQTKLNTDGAVFVKNIERGVHLWQKTL